MIVFKSLRYDDINMMTDKIAALQIADTILGIPTRSFAGIDNFGQAG